MYILPVYWPREPTLLVCLDRGAAFDIIDHSSLLSRLNTSFRVSDTALSWLASYLSGRSQAVRIGSVSSPPLIIVCLVFLKVQYLDTFSLVYLSPVGHLASSHQVKHQQYANDTQLYFSLLSSFSSSSILRFISYLTDLCRVKNCL